MGGALNCGVVGLPRDCELVDMLLGYYENLPEVPRWWNGNQRRKIGRQDESLPHAVRIYRTERADFGPQALTWFARQTGDDACDDAGHAQSRALPAPRRLLRSPRAGGGLVH